MCTTLLYFICRLGRTVALHPILTIIICIVVCGLFGIGMVNFKQTTEDAELWVPHSSRILPERRWVLENFPPFTRYASMIIIENNILSTRSFNAVSIDMHVSTCKKNFYFCIHHKITCFCSTCTCSFSFVDVLRLYRALLCIALYLRHGSYNFFINHCCIIP